MTNTIFRMSDYGISPGNMLLSLLTQLFLYTGTESKNIYNLVYPESKQITTQIDLAVRSDSNTIDESNKGRDHGLLFNGLYLESYMNLLFKHADGAKNINVEAYNTESSIVNGTSYNRMLTLLKGQETLKNLYNQLIPEVKSSLKTLPI